MEVDDVQKISTGRYIHRKYFVFSFCMLCAQKYFNFKISKITVSDSVKWVKIKRNDNGNYIESVTSNMWIKRSIYLCKTNSVNGYIYISFHQSKAQLNFSILDKWLDTENKTILVHLWMIKKYIKYSKNSQNLYPKNCVRMWEMDYKSKQKCISKMILTPFGQQEINYYISMDRFNI